MIFQLPDPTSLLSLVRLDAPRAKMEKCQKNGVKKRGRAIGHLSWVSLHFFLVFWLHSGVRCQARAGQNLCCSQGERRKPEHWNPAFISNKLLLLDFEKCHKFYSLTRGRKGAGIRALFYNCCKEFHKYYLLIPLQKVTWLILLKMPQMQGTKFLNKTLWQFISLNAGQGVYDVFQ